MKALRQGAVVLIVAASSWFASAQGFSAFTGHISDNTQHPVANLQVRLRPPANGSVAAQIGVTDSAGNFTFQHVQASKYLLEVSQGPYLLYRNTVNIPQGPVSIVVQRK